MTGNVVLDIRISGYTGDDIEIYKLIISNCEELMQEYKKAYDNEPTTQGKEYWMDRTAEKLGIIEQAKDAITALEESIQERKKGQVVE